MKLFDCLTFPHKIDCYTAIYFFCKIAGQLKKVIFQITARNRFFAFLECLTRCLYFLNKSVNVVFHVKRFAAVAFCS